MSEKIDNEMKINISDFLLNSLVILMIEFVLVKEEISSDTNFMSASDDNIFNVELFRRLYSHFYGLIMEGMKGYAGRSKNLMEYKLNDGADLILMWTYIDRYSEDDIFDNLSLHDLRNHFTDFLRVATAVLAEKINDNRLLTLLNDDISQYITCTPFIINRGSSENMPTEQN